jgi:hypothetical protein
MLEVTQKGVKGVCQLGYSLAPVSMCIGCVSLCHWEGETYIYLPLKPSAPNMLDELLKGFIVNPVGLPWKWAKRLITLDERVNHDSQ